MATNYDSDGITLKYTNTTGSAIVSGQVVVIDNMIGVALIDCAVGATGVIGFGVFRNIPKVTAAAIGVGETLVWDVSASKFDANTATPATGDVTGSGAVAWEAAANGDTTMKVKFTGVPGTVT